MPREIRYPVLGSSHPGEIALPCATGMEPEYASGMNRRMVFLAGLLAVLVVALSIFLPRLFQVLWSSMIWTLVAISVVLILAITSNIIWAIWSMYKGYDPSVFPQNLGEISPKSAKPVSAVRKVRSENPSEKIAS